MPASLLYTRTRASFFFFLLFKWVFNSSPITYSSFHFFFCYVFFCCCCCSLFSRRLCCPLSLSTKRKGKKIEFLPLLELVSNEDPEKHGVFGGCSWKQLTWVPSATEVNVFLFFFFWQPRTQEVYACCERPIKMELLLWRCDVLIRFFLCVCHTLVLRRDLLRCYSYTEAGKIKRKKREFTLTHRVFSPPVSSLRAFFFFLSLFSFAFCLSMRNFLNCTLLSFLLSFQTSFCLFVFFQHTTRAPICAKSTPFSLHI